MDDVNCDSSTKSFFKDTTYFLARWVTPSSSEYAYSVSFFTRIAFDLAGYGGSSTLSYEWQFKSWWGCIKAIIGSDLEMKSNVSP
ncbi:hypothetical protein FRB91_006061 [Serendipita sp. 411]|nr:hypothetical protein FRB91_006061 [Serendipita sp. 411]